MVESLIGEAIDEGAPPPPSTVHDRRLVRQAEEIMQSSLGEPLTVGALALQLGTSVRRLQYAFRRVRGVAPRTRLSHFGRFAAAYAARAGRFSVERSSDLSLIRVGEERYEIPDAVVLGG